MSADGPLTDRGAANLELPQGAFAGYHGDLRADVAAVRDELGHAPTVAEFVATTCAVGYGGHYDEVLEDCREGQVLADLAADLEELCVNYEQLVRVRDEWCRRLRTAAEQALRHWRDGGFDVPEPDPHAAGFKLFSTGEGDGIELDDILKRIPAGLDPQDVTLSKAEDGSVDVSWEVP